MRVFLFLSSFSLSSWTGKKKENNLLLYHGREREEQARRARAGEQGVERELRQNSAAEQFQLRERAASSGQDLPGDGAGKSQHRCAAHGALGVAGEHRHERRQRRRRGREQRVFPLEEEVGLAFVVVPFRFVSFVIVGGSRGRVEGGEAPAAAGRRGESECF